MIRVIVPILFWLLTSAVVNGAVPNTTIVAVCGGGPDGGGTGIEVAGLPPPPQLSVAIENNTIATALLIFKGLRRVISGRKTIASTTNCSADVRGG